MRWGSLPNRRKADPTARAGGPGRPFGGGGSETGPSQGRRAREELPGSDEHLKSGLGRRPIYHRAERRIRAQVALTVLALLLERMVELMVGDRWHNIRHDLAGIKLVELLGLEGTIWQVTEPRPVAAKHLRAREIASPPPILRVDCRPQYP